MKKTAFVLVAAAAAFLLPSCKKEEAKQAEAPLPSYMGVTAEIDPATGKVYDFGGMEVTIYDWWTDPNAAASSKSEEDLRAWRKWLMDTYNFKAVQKDLAGWQDHPKEVANLIMSGTKDNLVFVIDGRSAISGLQNDFWYDLGKIKDVDWNDEKWNRGIIDRLRSGSSFYTFNTGKTEPREGVIFNKRILEENGYDRDYPYDLQKEGKWTWDTFEEMCRKITKDTNNDGVIDQYAMSSFYTCFGIAAAYSNGGAKVKMQDGKFVDAIGDENSMEAWNWMYKMFQNYQLPQGDAQWDYWQTAFMNGETAFCVMQEYICQPNGTLSNMKDDWGWVCFPLGPKSDGRYFTIGDSTMWALPNLYDDATAAKIMKIIDFFTDPAPGYGGEDSWKTASYLQGFRDFRALEETCALMVANSPERLDTLIPDYSGEYMVNQIAHGWATPQETYEKEKAEIQSRLDAVNK